MQARYDFGTWVRRSCRPSDIADMICDVCKYFAFSDLFNPFPRFLLLSACQRYMHPIQYRFRRFWVRLEGSKIP